MKRDFQTLVDYLYKETSFPNGCVLLTGTGVVPPDDFTLRSGDQIAITIDGIGTLQNIVDSRHSRPPAPLTGSPCVSSARGVLGYGVGF